MSSSSAPDTQLEEGLGGSQQQPAAGSGSNTRAPAEKLLEEGLRLEKAGFPDRAIERYRLARELAGGPVVVAESWRLESNAHHARSAWDEALEAARRSAEAARAADRDDLLADALNAEAAVHFARGDLDQALEHYRTMLELTREPRVRGVALQNMGIILASRGRWRMARRRFEDAYEAFEAAGYDWGKAHVLNNRVAMALDRREYGRAEAEGWEAVKLARKIDDLDLISVATMNLAEALMGQGDLELAEREASQALGQFNVSGNAWRRTTCLRILGDIAARQGDDEVARRMWGSGLELAREIGASAEIADFEARLGS